MVFSDEIAEEPVFETSSSGGVLYGVQEDRLQTYRPSLCSVEAIRKQLGIACLIEPSFEHYTCSASIQLFIG